MESIKLKNEQYWDTSGVFDHEQLKTQEELNSGFTEDISDLKSAINKLGVNDNVYVQPEWEQGNLSISNYALDYSGTQTNWCRMVEGSPAVFLNGTVIRVKDPVYLFTYYYSGADGKWYSQGNKTEFTINASSGNYRMTFSVRRTDWHDITAEEAANAIEIILPFNPYNMRNEEYYKLFSLSDALIINGILWVSGNGVNTGSTVGKVSSFIPVSNGQIIKYDLSAGGNGRYVIGIYDTGFKFVSGVENTGAGTVTITADGYIRICCLNDYAGYVFFDYPIPDKIQVELDKINRTIVDDVTGTGYMQTALARIAGELKAKSVLGNIVTIGFSTDQHIKDDGDANATLPVLRGLTVLSKLTQAYPYDFVCLGGDACEAGPYATTPERILDECITVQKPLHDAWCPVVPITGNHDAAQNNANITGGMLFNAHFKRIANSGFLEGWDSSHANGYWDSAAHNIRFIFFDDTLRTDYTSTQRSDALTAMLTNIPEGYNIVIFSHHPLSTALTDSKWQNPIAMQSILDAFAARIICCICGHSHIDISETSGGILYIATTLAQYAYDQAGQRGTLNTETETAFDTFVIDQTNKHIYAIRYGHGENRDWAYTLT